jgi:ABC-type cobalamin/Fe3+-siderophores transport system ATPase subunit
MRAMQLPTKDRSLELLEINIIISKLSEQGETRFDKLLLFTDLSDGERAYLTRIALIHLLGQRESLFLLDEPETHFNDGWKRNLVYQVEQTLKNTESQVILTTHASIVLTDAYPEEIILLDEQGQQSVPLTFAAEQNELLRSVFGADRSVGRRAINRVTDVIKHGTAEQLKELLKQVGPGYYRYKIIEALERRVSQD